MNERPEKAAPDAAFSLPAQVRISLRTYANLFARSGMSWAQACARAKEFLPVLQRAESAHWAFRGLLDAMHATATQAEVDFESILALNCRTELLPANFMDTRASNADAAFAENRAAGFGECTAIGVCPPASAGEGVWLAQNWDWYGQQRAALRIEQGRTQRGDSFTTLTEAGMLAKIGLNHAGFAVGLNIIRSNLDGERPGVPVHVLLRALLALRSVAEARALLEVVAQELGGFGAASNIPCADQTGEVLSFELSPAGFAEWPAANGVMTHTNHFLCPHLQPWQAGYAKSLSTTLRLSRAEALSTAQQSKREPFGLEQLQSFLRDESDGFLSICRRPDPSLSADDCVESVAGVIINVRQPAMWVAMGVPSTVPFVRVV